MIAETAGKLIAPFVDCLWPADREKIYQILRLSCNRAWQEGKWLGMTSEFFLPVIRDHCGQPYIVAPVSHPILLAINMLGRQGITIRDQYFMFHRNGYGDIRNGDQCQWNQDVYDVEQYVPYVNKNNINFSNGVRVGVRALGPVAEGEKIFINGTYMDGNSVYTYKKNEGFESCGCQIDKDQIDTIKGVEIKIENKFNYISNVCFSTISSIVKTPTISPVEVIVIDDSGQPNMISRLEPNQRTSKYRKYLVPEPFCGKDVIHGLFKMAQQDLITSDTDSIMISNEEALIALAKGINNIYYKEQMDMGAAFIFNAIGILEKEKREEEAPSHSPIQVHFMYEGDTPPVMNYYS